MGMGTLLLALGLLQSDPRDRLLEAVRESRLPEVRQILAGLVVEGDPVRAAKALVQALPKARERIEPLIASAERARQAALDFDDSPSFDLREETVRERQRELFAARIRQLEQKGLEAERVYQALMDIFAFLKPCAAPYLAGEVERQGSWLLKCELLEGLAAMGARDLLRAAAEREPEPVVKAAAVEGMLDERAADYLAHPQWQLRHAALQAVRRSKGAAGAVIRAMQRPDARFRKAAAKTLEELTRTELPPDAALWRDWWEANHEDFLAGTYVSSAPRWPEGARPTVFYEVPLDSTRVCFLIDRSRSMREEGRLAAAKQELKRLLDVLPDGASINILFFGGTQTVLWKGPRVLDATARREAADFIERAGFENCTDLYGALGKALQFTGALDSGRLREDGIDTIVVLSDGRATWGRIVDEELLAATVSRKARYFKPVIHGVSLGRESKALRLLAEKTGGQYRVQ